MFFYFCCFVFILIYLLVSLNCNNFIVVLEQNVYSERSSWSLFEVLLLVFPPLEPFYDSDS